MEKTIVFSEIGTSLGTRNLGAKIREDIKNEASINEKIYIDLENVDVITNSFANECFGKLKDVITMEVFKEKISFINANEFVKRAIISAL